MLEIGDTIVGVGSPPGRSAQALVRVSGEVAIVAVDSLADEGETGARELGAGAASRLLRADQLTVPARALVFRAPRSYTGEDVVELWIPGSAPTVRAVVRSLLRQPGVRRAGPGEFTLRAFLSGRIDLSRAEAVAHLIGAVDADEARAARRALAGDLGAALGRVAERLLDLLARLEAGLDFPDEELEAASPAALLPELQALDGEIRALRESSLLRLSPPTGLHVVLAGLPNAGKSSLLNAILGRPAALVSDLAGTTRDPVRGSTVEGSTPLEWVDLAGVPSPGEPADAGSLEEGLSLSARRSLERMSRVEVDRADVVLWLVDPGGDVERSLAARASAARPDALLVTSKADTLDARARERWSERAPASIFVSSLTGEGLPALARRVVEEGALGRRSPVAADSGVPRYLVSAHQEAALSEAQEAVERAIEGLERGVERAECAAVDLREAVRHLEGVTGRVTSESILDRIFGRFCLGK